LELNFFNSWILGNMYIYFMKNEPIIAIVRIIVLSILVTFFIGFTNVSAQKINQFNKNNERTGVWKKHHSNKRIRYVGNFINGKEVGVFKYYDITRSKYPTIIKEFSITSDSAKVRYFNSDGRLRTKGNMLLKNRVGKWFYYFPNGELFSEELYIRGKLEGELKNYYRNGKTLEITQYDNGMKNGFSKKYSDQGILIEEVNYVDDVLNGIGKYFELNGNLKEEGIYRDGKRFKEWEFYIGGKKVTKKEQKEQNKFNKSDGND